MLELTPHECRVLGVLVEKAQTTPAQYPLTLNSIRTGANQKSNREPVVSLSDDDVITALDGLRSKGLVREVMLSGSRVEKVRHIAREALEVSTSELVVLTELLLRGPQTLGEVRGRATRMHPLESIEAVTTILEALADREEPLVARVAPAPGSRAPRYAQLLCRNLHPLDEVAAGPESLPHVSLASAPAGPTAPGAVSAATAGDLENRLARLETEVAALREAVRDSSNDLG